MTLPSVARFGWVDIEQRDEDGRTPFWHACAMGEASVARFLAQVAEDIKIILTPPCIFH